MTDAQRNRPLAHHLGRRPTADVAAVVGLWRDATPILGQLEAARGDVLLVTAVGGLVQ